jgi:hypothetical protein
MLDRGNIRAPGQEERGQGNPDQSDSEHSGFMHDLSKPVYRNAV